MFRSFFCQTFFFRSFFVIAFGIALAISAIAAPQDANNNDKDKHLDVQSSVGDLHLGADADARKAGLPLYPGARPSRDKDNEDAVNLGLFTEVFGVKLVVAKYESTDAQAKVIDYYREHLKKYGKVLECHTAKHADHANFDDDDDSKGLKCEGDNTGPVTELKVGTQHNQHVVAVQTKDGGSGSSFVLVYVRTRGKQGDI
jgi:hypothetical protein